MESLYRRRSHESSEEKKNPTSTATRVEAKVVQTEGEMGGGDGRGRPGKVGSLDLSGLFMCPSLP